MGLTGPSSGRSEQILRKDPSRLGRTLAPAVFRTPPCNGVCITPRASLTGEQCYVNLPPVNKDQLELEGLGVLEVGPSSARILGNTYLVRRQGR